MRIYRLDPIARSHPSWQVSSFKGMLWVAAQSADRARQLAAHATRRGLARGTVPPETPSPWLLDAATSCVWYPDKTDVPDETVLTAEGDPLLPC